MKYHLPFSFINIGHRGRQTSIGVPYLINMHECSCFKRSRSWYQSRGDRMKNKVCFDNKTSQQMSSRPTQTLCYPSNTHDNIALMDTILYAIVM